MLQYYIGAYWTRRTEEQRETLLGEEVGEVAAVVLQDLGHSCESQETRLLEMQQRARQSARDEDHPIAYEEEVQMATAIVVEEAQECAGESRMETAAVGSCLGSWLLWLRTMTILPVLTSRSHVAASSCPLDLDQKSSTVSK